MTTPPWHAPSLERAARLFRGMHAAKRKRKPIKASVGRPHKHATARTQPPAPQSPRWQSPEGWAATQGCQGPRQSHKAVRAVCSEALSTQNLSKPQCTSDTVTSDRQRGPLGPREMLEPLLRERLPVPAQPAPPSVNPFTPSHSGASPERRAPSPKEAGSPLPPAPDSLTLGGRGGCGCPAPSPNVHGEARPLACQLRGGQRLLTDAAPRPSSSSSNQSSSSRPSPHVLTAAGRLPGRR